MKFQKQAEDVTGEMMSCFRCPACRQQTSHGSVTRGGVTYWVCGVCVTMAVVESVVARLVERVRSALAS